jgi:hypothetical protein
MERKYKLAPGVLCCPSKKGMIEDGEPRPETDWEEDEAEERVREGYLVRVKDKQPEKV